MGEDEDAEMARGFDETGCRNRLSGSGRVAEPVAAFRARVGAVELGLEVLLLDESGVEVVVCLLVDLGLGDGAVPAPVVRRLPVAVLLGLALGRGDELGEHSRERVDLMATQLGPGCGAGSVLGQHALEPQHEAVAHLPARGGRVPARVYLR